MSNPIHKLLGKLPASLEHFKDTIYLRQPFPYFKETIGLLHDKCFTRKHNKPDSALVAQGKVKGKAKFSKENKSKKAPSSDSKEQLCTFCGRTGHLEEKCFAKRDASKKLKEASKEKTNRKNKQQPNNKGKGKDKAREEEDSAKVAFIAHSSFSLS